jgi:S1-C subfamily serine protease
VTAVTAGSPAEKAGLKANDVICKFDDKEITAPAGLTKLIQAKKAGDVVMLEILRGEETLKLKVEIGKRQ